jgi:hypothetical protein
MAFTLSRKSIVILILSFAVILGCVVGYILWRTNKDKQISEQESEAADVNCRCEVGNNKLICDGGTYTNWCGDAVIYQCDPVTGLPKVVETCQSGYRCGGDFGSAHCERTVDPCGGCNECCNGTIWRLSNDGATCNNSGEICQGGPGEVGQITCGTVDDGDHNGWGCSNHVCEYPGATYCAGGQCTCVDWQTQRDNQTTYPAGCTAIGSCNPNPCPADLPINCGISGDNSDKTGCVRVAGCKTVCTNCNNPSWKYRYCKAGEQPEPEYLRVSGTAYCSDDGGTTRYPVNIGTKVLFYKNANQSTNENLSLTLSGNVGAYTSASSTTQSSHGYFSIRLTTLGTGTLSTGQPYSSMRGPTIVSGKHGCTTGNSGRTGIVGQSYEQCNLANGQNYTGFDFVFTNCSPGVMTCGSQCTTLDQTCTGDSTICKSTPLGNRCVDPDNYDDVGKTIDQDYFDAGCEWPAPVNPDWSIEKRSNGYCIDQDTDNPKFKVDYSIIVRNTSSVNGDLDRVVDRPENTKTVWLVQSSIAPLGGVVNGGSNGLIVDITWTLTGADKTFTGGSSRTYSYSVIIPKDGFSKNYRNRATGYPSSGSEFSADSNIWASCKLPPTGIFDSVMSKVLVGTLLMLLGGIYLYSFNASEKTVLLYNGLFGKEAINHRRQVSNKKKVSAKRERFKMKQGN